MNSKIFAFPAVMALLALGLTLTSCASLKPSYPRKSSYVLEVTREGPPSMPVQGMFLKIRTLRPAPQFDQKGFVYKTEPLTFKSDYYNEFYVSPPALITDEIKKWVTASGLFEKVLPKESLLEATHTMEGEILELFGDYTAPDTPQAVMTIKLVFLEQGTSPPTVLFEKSYRKNPALKTKSVGGLVEAWNEALEEILTDFEQDLKTAYF
ncbi:MAG: hypothetical protein HYY14_06985 [Candidatus Omnitrophica bacterium]|nr:hypothetical protein [Candidatus Omnitrophota bacterium]